MLSLGCDIYMFSAYKVYGPHQGIMAVRPSLATELPNQGHFFNETVREKRLTPAGPDHAQIAAAAGIVDYLEKVAEIAGTLRLELNGLPVRVSEIAPGMVRTDEFAVNRFGGDAAKAATVYQGVAEPLTAEDIAEAVAWIATTPPHVNVDLMVLRPLAQAAQHKVHRVTS